MKTLQEIQEENRRLILEAIHGCSYEEAVTKELSKGCKIDYSYIQKGICGQTLPESYFGIVEAIEENGDVYLECGKTLKNKLYEINIYPRPNCLSRVLLALKISEEDDFCMSNSGKYLRIPKSNGATIFWDLTKETLESQSEETQRSINKLLTE